MGKNKRQKLAGSSSHRASKYKATQLTGASAPKLKTGPAAPKKQHQQQQLAAPVIPFLPLDRILLVGEGDLSFSASLVKSHGCRCVTATVLENNFDELAEKYPHVRSNVEVVEKGVADDESMSAKDAEDSASSESGESNTKGYYGKVLYGIDAGKMGPFIDVDAKQAGRGRLGGMDRIIFNFPHVGGKSTDVNRQVRYNQELLVSFFKRAQLSLARQGSIIVTLFEGEPYTLWNIRDLARHSGLQVERSFKFQASAYPGYHHARTLGTIKSKSGESGGGWKGEDRLSRSYVFVRKGDAPKISTGPSKRKKDVSSDDDEDSDV